MRERESEVIKGLSRRVVIVEPPDTRVFEQAIFIVREEAMRSEKMAQSELLRQAEREAEAYVASALPGREKTAQTCISRLISRLRRTMMRFSSRLM